MKKNSKLLLLAVATALLATSCFKSKKEAQQQTVQENVEAYLMPKLNDLSSYEFVSLTLVDSVNYKNNILTEKEQQQYLLTIDQEKMEREAKLKEDGSSLYNPEREIKFGDSVQKMKALIAEMDSIEQTLGKKLEETASYTYKYSFRGNNALGAKVLNEYIVQTSPGPDFKILNVTGSSDKVLLSPNGFPGYKELLKKYRM
jgi:DNA anti-recombination protein RmuC